MSASQTPRGASNGQVVENTLKKDSLSDASMTCRPKAQQIAAISSGPSRQGKARFSRQLGKAAFRLSV